MAQSARFIYHVTVVDMMIDPETGKQEQTDAGVDKEPDVIAEVTLCAGSPADAAERAFKLFSAESVVSQGRRYHVNALMYSPLPQTGSQIIVPNKGEAQAILRAGEIVPPAGKPGISA